MVKVYNGLGIEIGIFNGVVVKDHQSEVIYFLMDTDVFAVPAKLNDHFSSRVSMCVGAFDGVQALDEKKEILFTSEKLQRPILFKNAQEVPYG